MIPYSQLYHEMHLVLLLQQLVDFTGFYWFFTVTLKSIAVTLMVGTRTAIASKRSLNCGNIRVMPAASFVSTGIIDWLAARVRRRSGVIRVDHLLIVHRGVDRRDGTRLDAVSIIQQFNDGNYAIRGTGRV